MLENKATSFFATVPEEVAREIYMAEVFLPAMPTLWTTPGDDKKGPNTPRVSVGLDGTRV